LEALDAALTAAVRRQMVSDAPLGALLTDEVNSPLVSATAAQGGGALKAFTIVNGAAAGEPAGDTTYAQQLRLEHVVESYTPDKAIQWLERVIDACGEPLADVSLFPAMLVSNLARRDVTVVLAGDGGDELFWGDAHRLASVIEGATEFRQPRWLRGGRGAAKRLLRSKGDPARLGAGSVGEWCRRMDARLPDATLESLFTDFPEWPADFALYRYCGWQPDETAQWLRWNQINGGLARDLLKLDRASMFHSLEARTPFLDREVLDVAARVDWQSCLDLGEKVGKLPLRQALARRIKPHNNPSGRFAVPMAEWLRGPLLPVFYDSVLSRMEIMGLPLNRVKLNELLKEHIAGRADHSQWLWTLLVLSLWTDRYLER
jgi:asparagine synthase (glutamine-hydrolysing)